jgi:hypothetical protein
MPELTKDTRVLKDPVTGELISVPAAEADKRAAAEGLSYATLPEIQKYNEREKFGSAGQTAIGALELAGESATLGLYAPNSEDATSRRKVLRREHPGVALAAEAAGALPAIAASEATGGLAAAAGLSTRLAQAASVVAEGGVSGFAQEQVQAREEGRDIDAGNIFLYGVGGEIAGRIVPKALGAGLRRAAQGVEDVLGGQADNLLVRAEQRAGAAGSDVAKAAPGPERDRFLRDNAPKIVDDATEEAVAGMDRAQASFQDLGDLSTKRAKVKALVSKEHVGQDNWVVEQVDRFQTMKDEVAAFEETPGLAGMAKKLNTAIDDAEGKITASRGAADRFIAADDIKRTFQRYHVALGRSKMTAQDAVYHDQLMSIVDSVQEGLRKGLEDESLWGKAARFQADVNSAWHNRWFQGAPVTEADLARVVGRQFDAKPIVEFDPAKMRSFLQKDKIGRGLTEDKLKQVLEGYQEMAEAHRKWGMTDPKKLDKMQSDIAAVRKSLDTADEVNQAKPRADAQDASDAASDQLLRDVVPIVGGPLVAARRMLRNIDTAGKSHIGSAAQMMVNGVRRGAKVLDAVGSKGGAVGATAAGHVLQSRQPVEDRFRGTYPTLTQSFLAKRENIVTAMQEPDQLANAMADSLGDLAEAAPDLHLRVVMRMSEGLNYLSQNMPPGIEQSLLQKHASPPDVQAIKTFARLWEAVMDPGAVVKDFATMHATPAQARAIEAVHPDIYARLQNDTIEAIADSPVRPPYERLRYLNQIFKLGPALGGVWKPSVAQNIKNSTANAPANPEGLATDKLDTGPTNPRGIASIAGGPTSSA